LSQAVPRIKILKKATKEIEKRTTFGTYDWGKGSAGKFLSLKANEGLRRRIRKKADTISVYPALYV